MCGQGAPFMSWLRRNGLFLVALVALSAGALWIKVGLTPDIGQHSDVVFNIGGPFALTAHDGRTVTEGSWPGKLLLISFGYRFCPDVCPTNLQTGANALGLLGADADRVQQLFITLDPERDKSEALGPYVALFSPHLLGLSGTPEQTAAVVKTFRVYYRKVPGASADAYTVDHSAFTFLADDRGVVIKVFGHETSAAEMAAGIRQAFRRKTV